MTERWAKMSFRCAARTFEKTQLCWQPPPSRQRIGLCIICIRLTRTLNITLATGIRQLLAGSYSREPPTLFSTLQHQFPEAQMAAHEVQGILRISPSGRYRTSILACSTLATLVSTAQQRTMTLRDGMQMVTTLSIYWPVLSFERNQGMLACVLRSWAFS